MLYCISWPCLSIGKGKWLIPALLLALPGAALLAVTMPAPRPVASALYKNYSRAAYYAPVRDGTKLAITVFRPADGPATEKFPTLLWYMPGHRESINPKTGEITAAMAKDDLAFFTSQGYAIALAEMRGSGASFGTRILDRGPQIGRDGKDLVDWIAAQPWSSGRVGMIGSSYQGFSQYATAAERPAALKAIFPEIAGFDDYTSMFYPGGILNTALSDSATASIIRDDQNYYLPTDARPRLPAAPVIDEDGDGELIDEIPIDKNGNGTFLDDGPPTYRDGKARQDLYYKATREHLANNNLEIEKLALAPYRDSLIAGTAFNFIDVDPSNRPISLANSGIAVYSRGGWFDYHARDTVTWFATLIGKTPVRLMMTPTGHGSLPAESVDTTYRAGPYFRFFNDTTTSNRLMNEEKLRFFDHYVRGINNDFEAEPPVLIYVMGVGWRSENEWPLKRQQLTRFYFNAGNKLSTATGVGGTDKYRVDFLADSRSDGANRWNYGISTAKEVMRTNASGNRRLSYTGALLGKDMEVTGHPLLEISLTSSADESDVFAYLEDVAPDGNIYLVSEGQLRANFFRLHATDEIIRNDSAASFAVKPAFPWHGFSKADYAEKPFANGKVVQLTFGLMPTSWVFKAGHRIRVSLAGADFPSFALHPKLSPGNNPADSNNIVPVWSVKYGAGLSSVTLPIIP